MNILKTKETREECKEKQKEEHKEKQKEEGKEKQKEDKKSVQEYLEALQRLQAEFENYRKRVDRDKETFCKFAARSFIEKILPVLDNFERSLNSKAKENHDEFVKAVEMINNQLWDVLHKEGLKKIDAKGKPFNPELHEPLLQEESDEKPNTVIEVLEPGYIYHEKIIRHARVKLSKEKTEKKDNENNQNDNLKNMESESQ